MPVTPTMLHIPAGEFLMGSDAFYPDEGPPHRVRVPAFELDERPVTNAEFAVFVAATGYLTVAERPLDPAEFPDLSPRDLAPGRSGFHAFARAGGPGRLETVVALGPGRVLAAAAGPRVLNRRQRGPPGRAGVLRGRRCLCGLGRQTAAGRSRVGICGQGRTIRRVHLCVGRRGQPGRCAHGQHLAGAFPVPPDGRERVEGNVPGRGRSRRTGTGSST